MCWVSGRMMIVGWRFYDSGLISTPMLGARNVQGGAPMIIVMIIV